MSGDSASVARPKSTFKVVINHEEQYSIWPAEEPVPKGWRDEGTIGTPQECLAHVERAWTDMGPKSIRGDDAG